MQAFLRGSVVLLLALLLTKAAQHRSAALRHHVWAGAIIVQLALLRLIHAVPELPVGLPLPAIGSVFNAPAPATSPAQRSGAIAAAAPQAATIVLCVWLGGAALVLLRFLVGTLLMARTARRGPRIAEADWLELAQQVARDLGITRPVTLIWGQKVVVPVTWGVLYPMVLIPENARDWPVEQRRLVLTHEFAHVKRFDALTQLIAQVTLAAFWFSPLVWVAERRLRIEREHACDDEVLAQGADPSLYAEQLLGMARALRSAGAAQPAFAALAMASRSPFEGRLHSILDPARPRGTSGVRSGLLFVLLSLAIAVPVAAVDVYVAAPAAPAPAAVPAGETGLDPRRLEAGLSAISSSADLRAALAAHLPMADRPTLLMLARVARAISSSADKSAFLTDAAPRMLGHADTGLEAGWFEAVSTIESSYNRMGALTAALGAAPGDSAVRGRATDAATRLGHKERAMLLVRLGTTR